MQQSSDFASSLTFADLHRARKYLGHKDRWARQLSDFELGARQKRAEPTNLQEFLNFAADAARSWAPHEVGDWKAVVDKLSEALKGLGLRMPHIELVKTTGDEEFGGAAYTRGNAIVLPESLVPLPTTDLRRAFFLLAHELFHVLSRMDVRLRDDLYALLGFKAVDRFEYPTELESRRVSNPDAFQYLHGVTLQLGSARVDVVPVIQSRLPLSEAIQRSNFLDALDIVLLSVDPSSGEAARDESGDLVKYNFGNTNWVTLMRRNSSYIIHPEEVLADNFALLMEWRLDGVLPPVSARGFPVNDVDLLHTIGEILSSGN